MAIFLHAEDFFSGDQISILLSLSKRAIPQFGL